MLTGQSGLGWNPLHSIKKAASGVAHVATTAGKDVGKGAVFVVKKTVLLPTEFAVEITKAATRLALRPVTSRIRTLENRRANKIAWDARKSRTPTPAERAQAKSWTKSKLNHELPHGPLLALLAGAPAPQPELGQFGMSTNLGIAPAVIAALIPVFMALMNSMLSKLSRSGEAPVAIGPNGQIIVPPGMDPTMPDAAAQAAVDAGADGPTGPDGGPGGPGDMMPGGGGPGGGGGGAPGKSNLMLFGGLAVAGVLVIMLMSGSKPAAKK
jgi:hypothetical protein